MSFFRTQADDNYEGVRAEIGFITDLQLEIEAAMDRQGMKQRDLAKLLAVTEGRVSQILSDNGANLEARTIAKIANALGADVKLKFVAKKLETKQHMDAVCMAEWARAQGSAGAWARSAMVSNDDHWVGELGGETFAARVG